MTVFDVTIVWAMIVAFIGGGGWDLYRRIRSLAHRSLADELLRMVLDGWAIWVGLTFASVMVFERGGFVYVADPVAVLVAALSLGCWGASRIIRRRDWIADKRRRAEFGQSARKKLWKPAAVTLIAVAIGGAVTVCVMVAWWLIGVAFYSHPTNDDVTRVVHIGTYVGASLLALTFMTACAIYWRQGQRIAVEVERIAAADTAFLAGEPPAVDPPAESGGHE